MTLRRFRSTYVWPTPQNMIGAPEVYTMDSAAPTYAQHTEVSLPHEVSQEMNGSRLRSDSGQFPIVLSIMARRLQPAPTSAMPARYRSHVEGLAVQHFEISHAGTWLEAL